MSYRSEMFIKNISYSTWATGERIVVISVLNGSTWLFLLHFTGKCIVYFFPCFWFSFINQVIVKEIRIVLLFTEMR